MKVKECMCSNVCCISKNANITDCAKIMSDNHIGCVPVCDESKKLIGLITDRDLILRSIANGKDNSTKVEDIMTRNVCYCTPEQDLKEAEELMSKNQIRRLPVVDNNHIVGIITLGDFAKNKKINEYELTNTFENICKCDNYNAQ